MSEQQEHFPIHSHTYSHTRQRDVRTVAAHHRSKYSLYMQCRHNPCFAFGALSDTIFMCIPFSGYVNWVTTSTIAHPPTPLPSIQTKSGGGRWWECIPVAWNEIMYSFFLFCIFPISFWLPFYYILLLLLWSKWLTEAMWHTCLRATMKNMHMNAPVLSTVDKGLHSAQCRRVEHIVHSACILFGEVSMQIPSTQFVVYLLCWHEYLY